MKDKWRIETERLIVRPFREEDADALYRIKTDPQVTEFCPDFLDVDVSRADMPDWIRRFRQAEEDGDIDSWRCYAIENRETGEVMGCLSFGKQNMLREYDLGWMMIGAYTRRGYASEAAEAFAETFCRMHGVDYLTVVMDVDNPASRRTAEKSGFRLFEKRTVYDYFYNRFCDDYYYFRRYWSGCTLKDRFYGDSPYYGRSTSDGSDESCPRGGGEPETDGVLPGGRLPADPGSKTGGQDRRHQIENPSGGDEIYLSDA